MAEVLGYTTESWGIGQMSAFYVVMKKKKWDSLPPAWQKEIEKINGEWMEKTGSVWDELEKSGKTFFQKLGGKIITLSAAEGGRWKEAVLPVRDGYVKMTKGKGLPGDEVLKFAIDYIAKN